MGVEPLALPQLRPLAAPQLPEPLNLPAPVLELPRAEVPSYETLVFPFADGTFSNGLRVNTQGEKDDDQDKKPPENAAPPIKVPAPRVQVPQYQIPDKKPAGSDLPQLAEATTITLPGTDIQIPVPKAEIVSAAAVTSVISVTATLTASALFKRLVSVFKPLITSLLKKIDKMRKKKPLTFGRQRLELRRHRRLHKVKKDGSYILPS
jgi:hypothetical protein